MCIRSLKLTSPRDTHKKFRLRLHGCGQIFARTNFVPEPPVYMEQCKFCYSSEWCLNGSVQILRPVAAFGCAISKTSASVSSGFSNTRKLMKARGRRLSAFIVFECLETLMKHDARVFEIASQSRLKNKRKLKYTRFYHMLSTSVVAYLTQGWKRS